MVTLTLRNLEHSCLPIEETQIIVFDSREDFGMFQQNFVRLGEVVYMYGDISDSLDKALEEGYITLKPDDSEKAIPICLDSENVQLYEGTLWCYEHEWTPRIDPSYFPFQSWEYYQIAIEQVWCKTNEVKLSGIDDSLQFLYHVVEFNGKTFKVVWAGQGNDIYLHEYEEQK